MQCVSNISQKRSFSNISQKTWDWVILGLTFYTVIIVPANLAINK